MANVRLRTRDKPIPNGLVFYQPQTKKHFSNWSFTSLVNDVIAHRKGNAAITAQFNLPTGADAVANEVDVFNANVCSRQGWTDYIISGDTGSPLLSPLLNQPSRLQAVAGGAQILVEWLSEGGEAVPAEVSTRRARTCTNIDGAGTVCPHNGRGDWTRFFTVPISEAIRKELERKKGMNLSTPDDAHLGVCQACLCPLALKVHVPIKKIWERMAQESKAALDPRCWILSESLGQ